MSPDGSSSSLADSLTTAATSANGNGNGTGWHAIRPWTPPLQLTVREITSVSATFILSSDSNDISSSLASLVDEHEPSSPTTDPSAEEQPTRSTIIADALAKGLSVTVNGSSWSRVFIRIEDKLDEAVIIIYGLMPGRQYDITLGLVQGQVQRQVTTASATTSTEDSDDSSSNQTAETSTSTTTTFSSVPDSHPNPSPSTSPQTPPQPTLEDRLRDHQRNLSTITAEKESLHAQLKSFRRDSQKQDAALKSEIEILKRNSEKHTQAEHRAKQKILALQEAVKRAQAGIIDTEAQVTLLQEELPELERRRGEKERAYESIKMRAEKARKDRVEEENKTRKKVDSMRSELGALTARMEKLLGKREKLELSVPELEEKLREVEGEISRVEKEERELALAELERERERGEGRSWGVFDMEEYDDALIYQQTASQAQLQPIRRPSRTQNSSSNSTATSSVSLPLPPISRPRQLYQHHSSQQSWTVTTPPRQSSQTQPRANSIPFHIPPQPQPTQQPFVRRSSLTTSSPQHDLSASSSTSTLSRTAPAFEPGKPVFSSAAAGIAYPSAFPQPATSTSAHNTPFTSPQTSSASVNPGVSMGMSMSPPQAPIQRPVSGKSPGTIGRGRGR